MADKQWSPTKIPGIKKRAKDGKYLVILDKGRDPITHKQIKTQKVCSSLKEAKALLGQNSIEKKEKKVQSNSQVLFPIALDEYIESQNSRVSSSTTRWKTSNASRLKYYFSNAKVSEIETMDIENFFEWSKQPHTIDGTNFKGLTNNTLRTYKNELSGMWRWMMKSPRRYQVKHNVISEAEFGKNDKKDVRFLNLAELRYIIAYAYQREKDPSIAVMLALAGCCGMRRGEVSALQYKQLDEASKTILVDKQLILDAAGRIIESLPKDEKTRVTAYPVCVKRIIDKAKADQERILQRKITADDKVYIAQHTLVMLSKNEEREVTSNLKLTGRLNNFFERMNNFRKIQGLIEIERVTYHGLRHSFATIIDESDEVNPRHLSYALGHSSAGLSHPTTEKNYLHDVGSRQDIVAYIDKVFDLDLDLTK